MNERAPIAGPYHGTRVDGSTVDGHVDQRLPIGAPTRAAARPASIERPGSIDASVPPLASEPLHVGGERVGVGQRHQRTLIEEPQVADLIANRPSG